MMATFPVSWMNVKMCAAKSQAKVCIILNALVNT